jgi:hypothetical protein
MEAPAGEGALTAVQRQREGPVRFARRRPLGDSSAVARNDNPSLARAASSFGIELGPIPCSARMSFTVRLESAVRVVIPSFSRARLAGALSSARNPAAGFLCASQIGHVGQSELFLYRRPFGHVLMVLGVRPMLAYFATIARILRHCYRQAGSARERALPPNISRHQDPKGATIHGSNG